MNSPALTAPPTEATQPVPAPVRRRRPGGYRTVVRWLVAGILLAVVVIVMVYPFVWMVSGSFKRAGELLRVPPTLVPDHPTLENYRTVAGQWTLLGRMYLNSILVASAITAAQALTTSTAAFAFARLRFRGRSGIFAVFMAAMMVPSQLTIIPNFVIMKHLN